MMEGLYIKVKENGMVAARYKFVPADVLTVYLESGSHGWGRSMVPNQVVTDH